MPGLIRRRRPLAFALAYFLLAATVMVLLTLAIVGLCRRQLFSSASGIEHNRALYAAESGMNMAVAQLEKTPAWTIGYNQQATLDGLSSYSLHFAAPASAGPTDSVNNLAGSTPVASYRGPGTVPAHSLLLVVEGRSGVTRQTVEALLVPGANALKNFAVAATGGITMRGQVAVDGVRSLTDLTAVPASLHSNAEAAGTHVTYTANGVGDSLTISGSLTSSSSSPVGTAIQLANPSAVTLQQSQLPPKRFPSINVEAVVSDHSGSPGPPPPGGAAPFTLNGGDNYYPGDLVINGDLKLNNGARLYVAGSLTVNGSVSGSGAIAVTGTTRIHGDADISADFSDYVSVLSKGSVVLEGFDGETYMNTLTAASTIDRERWEDLRFSLKSIRDYLQAHAALTPVQLGVQMQNDDIQLDSLQSIVAAPWRPALTEPVSGRPRHQNTVASLKASVGTGTPSQEFLANRLQSLDDLFRIAWNRRDGSGGRYTAMDLIDQFSLWDPELDGGLFDSIQSFAQVNTAVRAQVLQSIQLMIYQLDYNRLGSANFKGFIYTSGAFVAHSDVNLLGSVIVNGDPTVGPVSVNSLSYAPGELAVLNNCRITYVDEMFRNGVQNIQSIGALDIKRWINR